MKNQLRSRSFLESAISRRKFIGQTAAAAVGFSIVPRRVLGGPGFVAPSDKVNIAFIGVGAQGLRVMLHFLHEPDVQGVAVCDVNKSGADYPQWDTHEFCKSVRKLLGVDSGWDWLSPDQPIQLSHTLAVTSGVAGREPCQKIVEGYYGTQKRSGQYQQLRGLQRLSRVAGEAERSRRRGGVHHRQSACGGFGCGDEKGQTCFLPEAADAHDL